MRYTHGLFGILNTDDMEEPPLLLLDGGIEIRFQENYSYDNHNRENYKGYVFQYTLSGWGWFEKNGRKYRIPEGMGFLAKIPEKSSYFLEEGSGSPWEFLYLHFDGEAVKPFLQKLEQLCGCVFSLKRSSRTILQFMTLHTRLTEGEHLQKYEGQAFLYSFLCSLLRDVEFPSPQEKNLIVQLAADILNQEYASLESMEALSKRLGVSKEHLTRCFRTELGIPPIRYLTNRRLQSAMNELLSTKDSINTIAVRNGFSNGNYFAKVFRKHLGMSPEEYRQH